MPRPALELKGITKIHGSAQNSVTVLSDANLVINPAEVVILIGKSGTGKTTALQIAGLLSSPTKGEVFIEGDICGNDRMATSLRRKKIGFIYQFHHLLPEFNILYNVMMPLLINGIHHRKAKTEAIKVLEELGLSSVINKNIWESSGGQCQRAAVARAIIHKPSIIIADEPTGNLDDENSLTVLKMLLFLVKKYSISLLITTHNPSLLSDFQSIITIKNHKFCKV